MYVHVNTNVINNHAKNISEYIKDFENGFANVKNTINNISTIWKGNDYSYFAQHMDSFIQELEQIKKTLDTYNEFLKGYSNAVDKLENYYGSKNISTN